jgi:hypothetical protein
LVTATAERRGEEPAPHRARFGFHHRRLVMSQRELVEPHPGDNRFQRRKQDGTFGESDDAGRSIAQDVKQHSSHKKPRNEGDKGD